VRKALNDNPVAQLAIVGVLAVVVAFLLLTRVMNQDPDSGSATAPAGSASGAPSDAAAPPSGTTTTPAAPGAEATAAAPSPSVPVSPGVGTEGASGAAPGAVPRLLVAGPGLPKEVAIAYAENKAIVLFVFRNRGLDDAAVRASVERLRRRPDLAVFVTRAGGIARYARITEGVDVDRVPALIVVRPRRLADGVPTATVSYGFRGAGSVQQAVRDALYEGPTNLPYYPR
jgi:hypothetical protein